MPERFVSNALPAPCSDRYGTYLDLPLELHFLTRDGGRARLLWDPQRCLLARPEDGKLQPFPEALERRIGIEHRRRMGDPRRGAHGMCIQLGRACNYRCAYCCQGEKPEGGADEARPPRGIAAFLDVLKAARKKYPALRDFAFWGGEPLLYYSAVRELAEGIRSFCPDAELHMITNGSLLSEDKADWLIRMGFSLGISHDGPDNRHRGGDPLARGSASRAAVDRLVEGFRGTGKMSFNPVFSAGSHGQRDVALWFMERFGQDVALGEGAPCYPPDDRDLAPYFGDAELADYTPRMLMSLMDPAIGPRYTNYAHYVRCFLKAVLTAAHTPHGGACGAYSDLPFTVSLDTDEPGGEVLLCHNFEPDYVVPFSGLPNRRGRFSGLPNRRGRFADLLNGVESLRPHGLPGWEKRPDRRCRSCPVLPLCRGGCPMVDDATFDAQCRVRFAHYMGLFGYALYLITGHLLTGVEGEFFHARQPAGPRQG